MDNEIRIQAGGVELYGNLLLPLKATGLAVFAHGSGSSRFSTRNRLVADMFNNAGLGALLFDLLTTEEQAIDERTGKLRFDIPLLGERMMLTLDWLSRFEETARLGIGLFGASTGAAAALIAAAARPDAVQAVVSRGGRPDLAADVLDQVKAPTLLLIGSHDTEVIELNRQAFALLDCEKRIEIVPGATHLFREAGKLEAVGRLARDWFGQHLHLRDIQEPGA